LTVGGSVEIVYGTRVRELLVFGAREMSKIHLFHGLDSERSLCCFFPLLFLCGSVSILYVVKGAAMVC